MARGAQAAAKEKLLPGAGVSRGPGVVCGDIAKMQPCRERLQLALGERERGHTTGRSIFYQVSNLTFVAASQAAAVD